jgi:hypothetical protein
MFCVDAVFVKEVGHVQLAPAGSVENVIDRESKRYVRGERDACLEVQKGVAVGWIIS